jgi:hypothetical protein
MISPRAILAQAFAEPMLISGTSKGSFVAGGQQRGRDSLLSLTMNWWTASVILDGSYQLKIVTGQQFIGIWARHSKSRLCSHASWRKMEPLLCLQSGGTGRSLYSCENWVWSQQWLNCCEVSIIGWWGEWQVGCPIVKRAPGCTYPLQKPMRLWESTLSTSSWCLPKVEGTPIWDLCTQSRRLPGTPKSTHDLEHNARQK